MDNNVLDRYASFRAYIASQFSTTTQEMVDKALCFADEELRDRRRYDGSPLLDHGVAMARIVAESIGLGRNSTIAAIIHDIVRIAVHRWQKRGTGNG